MFNNSNRSNNNNHKKNNSNNSNTRRNTPDAMNQRLDIVYFYAIMLATLLYCFSYIPLVAEVIKLSGLTIYPT